MEIKSHTLQVSKTAHYATYGELTEHTKYFWFALHGSHMLCKQMLYKFKDFNPQEHFVVAPEGLSRFYFKGYSGDVVSTWMTKEDRLVEIEDFSVYLDKLYRSYTERLPKECKKLILGFSQGGTTVFRWLHRRLTQVDTILAYSAWVPEDLDYKDSITDVTSIPIIYTVGLQDEFVTAERIEMQKAIIARGKLAATYELYKGVHKIDRSQLMKIFIKHIRSMG